MTTPTALPRLAEVADLKAWPGVTVNDDQIPAAEAVLSRASAVVRRAAGKTFLNADGSGLDPAMPEQVRGITVEAAAAFWNNPNAATLRTRGPFTEGFSQAIEAGVYLTQTQKDDLEAISAASRPKLWSIPTTRLDPQYDPSNYVPVDGSATDFPWYGGPAW